MNRGFTSFLEQSVTLLFPILFPSCSDRGNTRHLQTLGVIPVDAKKYDRRECVPRPTKTE